MNRVFISYSTKDEQFVRRFYERLKANGLDCFFDRESIPKGDDWIEVLERKLKACDIYVVFLTPEYFKSEWTKLERSVVIKEITTGGKNIIPLLLKECDVNISPFLQTRQLCDITSESKYQNIYPEILRQLGGNPGEDFQPIERNFLPPLCRLPEKHRMPYRSLGNGFVGRVGDLWDIDESLRKDKTTVVQGVGVVTGMAGVGKTQLAVEYVHRFGKYYPGGVFWVEADQGLPALLVLVCRAAGIDIDNRLEEKEQLEQLWQILSSFLPVLVVLDNFPEKIALEVWLPPQSSIHVLVTTRRKDLFNFSSFSLDVLTKEEGVELLNSGKRKFTGDASDLVEAMGGLPLAIELAKNFLNLRTNLSITGLLEEIKKKGEIKTLGFFAGKYENELPTGHSKEVAATFQLSWDIASDFAKTLLQVIALLAPVPVPRRVLKKIFDTKNKEILDDPVDDVVAELTQKLSLTELDDENDPSCHRLISAFVRTVIKNDTDLNNKIVRTILNEMKRTAEESDTASLRELEKIIPHADYLLTLKTIELKPEQAVDMAHYIGWHYSRWGRYRISKKYREEALFIAKANFKPGDPIIASCFVHLGQVFDSLGNYKKAIEYYEKGLQSDLKTYDKNHPQVAISLNNLGSAWQALGKYDKAIEYYENANEINIKHLRKEHPHVAATWNNLGSAWQALGKYDKAIEYYEKALQSDLKTYGKDHPQVAIKWNNVGSAWEALGQYEKAISYYEKALSSDLKTYGEEHPSVAIRWNNLGMAWQDLGQYEKAFQYFEEALQSDLKTYGKDHPQVAIKWNNLGRTCASLGKYEKAIEYYEKSLNIFKSIIGEEHPKTIVVQKNIADLLYSNGGHLLKIEKWHEALKNYMLAKLNYKKIGISLGMANSCRKIGDIYELLNDYEKSRWSYKDALRIYKYLKKLHDIALTEFNLGRLEIKIGFFDDALKHLKNAAHYFESLEDKKNFNFANELIKLANKIKRR